MITVRRQVQTPAPPRDVFEVMTDFSKRVQLTPSLVELTGVTSLPGGGQRATYTYEFAGIELGGSLRDVRRRAPNLLVQSLSGAIDGTVRETFEASDVGSLVTHTVEYDLADAVLESIGESVARTYTEREVEATLTNLKSYFES